MSDTAVDPPVREPALAGVCYPESPEKLREELVRLFSGDGSSASRSQMPKALFAPHIDPRVGIDVYRQAFSLIGTIRPRRVVILATAHYTGYYPQYYSNSPFVGTRRTFRLPHGDLSCDTEWMDRFEKAGADAGYTARDDAHLAEHSIELHLLFARFLWQHDFRIVPILVDTFDQLYYFRRGQLNRQIDTFVSILRELDDGKTFYLISGDLSHVGRRFGDPVPAEQLRERVEPHDRHLLATAASKGAVHLLDLVADNYDPFRVCGFPPLYTFLNLFPDMRGDVTGYHWWDDSDTHSAVSFGSILYGS